MNNIIIKNSNTDLVDIFYNYAKGIASIENVIECMLSTGMSVSEVTRLINDGVLPAKI